jgi:hypothetical protein
MRDNNIDYDVNSHKKIHQRESHRAHNKDKDEDKGQRQQHNYNDDNNNNHDNDEDNNNDDNKDDNQRLKKIKSIFLSTASFSGAVCLVGLFSPAKTIMFPFRFTSLICTTW